MSNLTSLLPSPSSTSTTSTVPSPDRLTTLLINRYKQEITSTWLGDSILISLNPLQVLPDVSITSQEEYERASYNPEGMGGGGGTGGERKEAHAFELACRAYLMMRRTGQTQSIVYTGLTGSGVTTQQHLVTAQILRLASFTKRDTKLATQIDAFETILASFGSALTLSNPTASRHSTFTELHFSHQGKLQGAKVLAWGLDKGRVSKLGREERSFNAFYQLLAGATEEERRELGLLSDASEYNLLASSGYYSSNGRGMNGNDDGIALDKLRNAMALLSFKPRHVSSIFRLLSVILLLGNLKFADRGEKDLNSESAWVSNRDVLETVASLLGINSDDLESSLTNRVRWVRKEMCAIILKAEAAALQRDSLVEALYSILFSFVVETSNHKVFPGDEAIASLQAEGGSSILQLDSPGFTSKSQDRSSSSGTRSGNNNNGAVLMRSLNGFEEFAINYTNESVHFWLNERLFDGDSGMAALAQEDGVRLPDIIPPDGSARLELLRGGRIGGKADRKPGGLVGGLAKTCSSVRKGATTMEADEELLRGMRDHFGDQAAFVSNPGGPGRRSAFGINHFAGVVAYDAAGFIERDLGALDPEFVALLRGSEDGFISKLFSGPSLAAEFHPLDGVTIVSAQISNQPLRRPSPVKTSPSLPHSEVDFTLPLLNPAEIFPLTSQLNATVSQLLNLIDRTQLWSVICLRPNDSGNVGMIDSKRLKSQIIAYNLPELTARKQIDFVTEVDYDSFVGRYHGVDGFGREAVGGFMKSIEMDNGVGDRLREMRDYALGSTKVWLSYKAWKRLEDRLRVLEPEERAGLNRASTAILEVEDAVRGGGMEEVNFNSSRTNLGQQQQQPGQGWRDGNNAVDSVDDLLLNRDNNNQNQQPSNRPFNPYANTQSFYSTAGGPSPYIQASRAQSNIWGMDDDQQYHQQQQPTQQSFNAPAYSNYSQADLEQQSQSHQTSKEAKGLFDAQGNPIQNGIGATVEVVPTSRGRMFWVIIVWALTWWVPSFCLTHVGRMKRPDVRMAWREKVSLCILIALFCGTVIFYIVVFGKLICPGFDNAWNTQQVSFHQGTNDYWVSVRGQVYDLTNYYRLQHSDIQGQPSDSFDMLQLAGQDLTPYFPIPPPLACSGLTTDNSLSIQFTNFTATVPTAVHLSGPLQPITTTQLYQNDWYTSTFLPRMKTFYKGPLVWAPNDVLQAAQGAGRMWAIYNNKVYDLTDYFGTINAMPGYPGYNFLDTNLSNLWQQQAGQDITATISKLAIDPATLAANMACITNLFYVGETDFRLTARCQVQPYLLLTFSIILVSTILAKFLAALQLGSKKSPEMRDKFVICQVPCYTEGEESLKQTIDSLATLAYDDKRKLLLIICDGMIIGSGNDRPTPRIVLDIFGVDQTVDPEPLMFKSVGEGSKQLNYGKVWSGLYEIDGHVVPYVVVAKVGRPSERSRPGNRGKRDSQILAMRFLNRVHFDSEMYPLELEMYHQIKNVIGVDPQLYEYMLVIDADTSVAADSLNRLVSCAADDSRIIGICGETKLSNEQESWWTMIQVYEYFISHHMSKAFESLFGSVTCLPGCFTMYRIRSADKGKPLLVSSLIIEEYSDCNLDTLHKKNLLALGEDRYLTTLILKHFPNYKTKFTPDAQAMTVAPERWSILLSQRRRWINSTVHNLAELMFLPDMCGFCCFGMRFIVIIDLVGTLILPATFVYLIYLIVSVSTGSGAIPLISLIMLGAVYGLQVIIFLVKRQWQFIGWLVIYIIAFPIYSFILPVYSFWCFDDFTWGSTRVVVGEGKSKKILSTEDEAFDESMIPMKKFSEYQAAMLDDDDKRSIHSLDSRRTQSIAGFSLATKKRGPYSYHGGADYYRDSNQSRMGSRSPTMNFPPPNGAPPSNYHGYQANGSPRGSQIGGNNGSISNGDYGHYPGQSGSPLAPSFGPLAPPPPLTQHQSNFSRSSMMSQQLPSMRPVSGMSMGNFASMNSMGGMSRPMSSYSLNPFGGNGAMSAAVISDSADPGDGDVIATLRSYLAHQDLMTVTKRSAREALQNLYPRADLSSRKDLINSSIDGILQGTM